MRTAAFGLSLVLLACASAACSGGDGGDANVEGESAASSDPRASIGAKSIGVVLTENGADKSVGSKKKIKSVMDALAGRATKLAAAPRCGPPRMRLAFAGSPGEGLGTIDICEEGSGFLHAGNKWYRVPVNEAALHAAFDAKLVVADVTWGITEIRVTDGTRDGAMSVTGDDIEALLKGVDAEASPQSRTASQTPRCAPSRTLELERGDDKVATIALFCPDNEDSPQVPSTLSVGGKQLGWITYDLSKVLTF